MSQCVIFALAEHADRRPAVSDDTRREDRADVADQAREGPPRRHQKVLHQQRAERRRQCAGGERAAGDVGEDGERHARRGALHAPRDPHAPPSSPTTSASDAPGNLYSG